MQRAAVLYHHQLKINQAFVRFSVICLCATLAHSPVRPNLYNRAALFINKRFVLNKMFQRNASEFAIFHV